MASLIGLVRIRLDQVSKAALAEFAHFKNVSAEVCILAEALSQKAFDEKYAAFVGQTVTLKVVGLYRNERVQIAAVRLTGGLEARRAPHFVLSLADGVAASDTGLGMGGKDDLLGHIGGESDVWAELTGVVELVPSVSSSNIVDEDDEDRAPQPLQRGWATAALQAIDVGLRPLSPDDKRRVGAWKPRQGDASIQLDLEGWVADKNPESKTGEKWQGIMTRPDGSSLTTKKKVLVEKGRAESTEGALGLKVEGIKRFAEKFVDVPVTGDVGDVWCAQMGRADQSLTFDAVSIQFGEFVFPEWKPYKGPGKEKGNEFAQVTISGVLFNINGVPKGSRLSGVYKVEVRVKRLRYVHWKDATKNRVRAVYTVRITAHDRAPKATHRLYLTGPRAQQFSEGTIALQGPQQAKIVIEPIEK